jgi:hypothetical protein
MTSLYCTIERVIFVERHSLICPLEFENIEISFEILPSRSTKCFRNKNIWHKEEATYNYICIVKLAPSTYQILDLKTQQVAVEGQSSKPVLAFYYPYIIGYDGHNMNIVHIHSKVEDVIPIVDAFRSAIQVFLDHDNVRTC